MPEEYTALVTAMKALTQGETPNTVTLKVAENEWETRPEDESYGIITWDFEADALNGNDVKLIAAHEGSFDLYSLKKDGAGWIPLIKGTLTEYCGAAWKLNHHAYERETGLFHWEWVFQFEE